MILPLWAQATIAIAAFVVAASTLWVKVLRPMLRAAARVEEAVPVLNRVVDVFKDAPLAFERILAISEQFKTDGGSSLRDVVNSLHDTSLENRMAAEVLKVGVEASKQLAAEDRKEVARLAVVLGKAFIELQVAVQVINRLERTGERVATNLAVAQTAVDGVAADLVAAHEQADAVGTEAPPGEAADAGARTPEPPKP